MQTYLLKAFSTVCFLSLFNFQAISQGVALEKVSGIGNSSSIYDLEVDTRGDVWIASDKGLYKVESKRPKTILAGVPAIALAKDKANVYTALINGTILKNGKTLFTIENPNTRISSLETVANNLWIGTETDGVFIYDIAKKKLIKHHTNRNSKLKSNRINFIFKDSNKTIWLGTNKGVVKVNGNKWKLYDDEYRMLAMTETSEELWLLSDQEMWQIHSNGKRWEPLHLKEGWSRGRVNDIIVDKEKKIYIASQRLVRIDAITDSIEVYSDAVGYLSQECLSLAADDNQHIWFGTKNSGLYVTSFGLLESALAAIYTIDQTVDCSGESYADISIKISGGAAPFKLNWSDSNIEGMEPKAVKSGVYSLSVSDASGQETVQEIIIPEAIPIQATVFDLKRVSKAGRENGEASVRIEGGSYPYKVKWESGENGVKASRLAAGEQTVLITDANGCRLEVPFEIEKSKILPDLDITTVTEGQTLRIDQLFFAADSSNVSLESNEVLEEIYYFLSENANIYVEIGGHTNSIPPHEYCDKLSNNRAKSVANYLYEKGIHADRVSFKGYGKRNPISSNETAEGRRKNQRVEIKILKIL